MQKINDEDIEIPSCTKIGFNENPISDHIKEISQIDQESVQQKFSEDLPLPKPLPKESKKIF
jgi:hypothetical protein